MYLIAFYSHYYMTKPAVAEATDRLAVRCLTDSMNRNSVSYVVKFCGTVVDHSYFSGRDADVLREFFADEVAA